MARNSHAKCKPYDSIKAIKPSHREGSFVNMDYKKPTVHESAAFQDHVTSVGEL